MSANLARLALRPARAAAQSTLSAYSTVLPLRPALAVFTKPAGAVVTGPRRYHATPAADAASAAATTKTTSSRGKTTEKSRSGSRTRSVKKSGAKKPKPKVAAPKKRKALSPEAKARKEKAELKVKALFSEPKVLPTTAWTVYVQEHATGAGARGEKIDLLQYSREYIQLDSGDVAVSTSNSRRLSLPGREARPVPLTAGSQNRT